MSQARYSKQIKLPGFGMEGQLRLKNATVAIIGLGGLGCPVAASLTAAGVGRLILIDGDMVDVTNLARQHLYSPADVGRLKTQVAYEKLTSLNPETILITHPIQLTPVNALELLQDADLVVDCTDNFPTRYLVNDACVLLNKPWVFGAVEGWVGQVGVLNAPLADGQNGPTYRCLFPEPPAAEDALACDDLGVLGSLPAVVGSLQATEALKFLSRSAPALSGRLLTFDMEANVWHIFEVARNESEVAKISSLLPDYSLMSVCSEVENTLEISRESYLSDKNAYRLVDIREEFEFDLENAGGDNLPYSDILADPEILKNDKPVLLICDSGKRSHILAAYLIEKGLAKNIFSLKGGLEALKKSE